VIRCKTLVGRDLPGVEDTRAGRGRITRDLADAARNYLNWPHERFVVPQDILSAWRDAGRRSQRDYDTWNARLSGLGPDPCRLLQRRREGRPPDDWREPLRALRERALKEPAAEHGFKPSGEIVDCLARAIPELISGAPDLEGATQHKRSLKAFTAADKSGRQPELAVAVTPLLAARVAIEQQVVPNSNGHQRRLPSKQHSKLSNSRRPSAGTTVPAGTLRLVRSLLALRCSKKQARFTH